MICKVSEKILTHIPLWNGTFSKNNSKSINNCRDSQLNTKTIAKLIKIITPYSFHII
jgi:hypothetical protein